MAPPNANLFEMHSPCEDPTAEEPNPNLESLIDERNSGPLAELGNILRPATEETFEIFLHFMTKIAEFDDAADKGKQSLITFHQELEYSRRPSLCMSSEVVSAVVTPNLTDRMKTYLEAEGNHPNRKIESIYKMHLCTRELEDHLRKAKLLLSELECLSADACLVAVEPSQQVANFVQKYLDNAAPEDPLMLELLSPFSPDKTASLMMLILASYALDYTMQEKIVGAVVSKLPPSSSELESYCLMWDLHPHLNDSALRDAWKLVP